MTRSDVMASSRPPTAGAASITRGWSGVSAGLLVLPVALVMSLALLLPSLAAAAEPNTSTYGEHPPTTTSKTGTLPSKEAETPTTSTPAKEPAPAKEVVPTTTSTTPVTTKQLPFTGFDLRWDIAFGVLLMGAGLGILTLQRRQRR
jgi:hypothetical protein